MAAFPALTQRTALSAALAILQDLTDTHPCDVSEHGQCEQHGWRPGPEACPQLRLRLLLQELEKQAPTPPYTQLSLVALLRGCTPRQQVHVRVQINGWAHRGVLGLDEEHTAVGATHPFHVDLAHGERVEQVSADDILEADVCTRPLPGAPRWHEPTHDPK